MKTILLFVLSSIYLVFFSCSEKKTEKETKKSSTIEVADDYPQFKIESKGIEVGKCYLSIDKDGNEHFSNKIPFGSQLSLNMTDIKGLIVSDGNFSATVLLKIYDKNGKIIPGKDSETIEATGKKEDLKRLQPYIHVLYPLMPEKLYTILIHVKDNNSDNEVSISYGIEITGKIPGDMEVISNNVEFYNLFLSKNGFKAIDNVFNSGDLAEIEINDVIGFQKSDNGYEAISSFIITDLDGNIWEKEDETLKTDKDFSRLYGSFPFPEITKTQDIFWILIFKDKNSDASIEVKTKLRLEP
jgi:hypothetical protein